jgi:catechol O-methyltransferase
MDPKPRVVVEFGTYVGCSALAWGATLAKMHGKDAEKDSVKVFAFELEPPMAAIARDFVSLAGLQSVVEVIEGPGAESLKKLCAEGRVKLGGVDVVFLDHWEQLYLPDLQLCESLKVFHKGSVVMADNTDVPGAPDYLAYVKKGGSGEAGKVRFESKSLEAMEELKGEEGRRKPVSSMSSRVVDCGLTCRAENCGGHDCC